MTSQLMTMTRQFSQVIQADKLLPQLDMAAVRQQRRTELMMTMVMSPLLAATLQEASLALLDGTLPVLLHTNPAAAAAVV
jgi:hypothetical protein